MATGIDLGSAIAVVTGASSGIGWATAASLARAGAAVVVSARRQERLDHLVEEIERRGGTASAVACDVTDNAQVEALRDRVHEIHGRCDVLVNNAGVPGGGRFIDLSVEQIERVVRTNLLGVLYGTKAFLPGMLRQGRGHVVNVASLAGRFAVPGASVYSATKHGVVAFSESLNVSSRRDGVLVTAVNPVFVPTEGFPAIDRPSILSLTPERVAETIVKVVREGIAPEVSIPRWVAPFEAFRVLTPPLYRWAVDRIARSYTDGP